MVQNILLVAGQVLSLFLLMAVGFVLTKIKKLDEVGSSQMSSVLLSIVAPCVIINSLQREKDMSLIRDMGIAAAILTASVFLSLILSQLFFRREKPENSRVLRFSVTFSNCGYMGLPLVEAALGPSAVIYAASAVVAFNILVWTLGVVMMGGRKEVSLRKALINPGTVGFLLGFLLFWFEITLSPVIAGPVSMLASLNTPVAMLIIGGYVASSNLLSCFSQPRLYVAAVFRLLLIPACMILAVYPLHLPYELYAASVLVASAPTAAITAIFANRYRLNPALGSQSVTLSTLLSILTMPLAAAAIRALCGM